MDSIKRLQLRKDLESRRDTIAAVWRQAITESGNVKISSNEVQQRLEELTQEVIEILLTDPFKPGRAKAIGRKLAGLHYLQPEELVRTQMVLAEGLVEGLSAGQIAALHPCLVELLSYLAIGFNTQVCDTMLFEQDNTRKELIIELELTQKEMREAYRYVALRIEQRTCELSRANERLAIEIAERVRVEQELERFFNLSFDMLCISGFDGYAKRVNRAFEKTLGYTAEEILERPFLDFVHPEDHAVTIAKLQELNTGTPVVNFTQRCRCKDGSYKWLEWTNVPVIEEGLMYAAARDITERKQTEEKLLRSEELLIATGKTALVGGWMVDIPSMEATWTEEVYRIHEVEHDCEMNIERGISFYTPEHQPIIEKAVQAAIDRGESYDLELGLITAKGKRRWVHTIGEARQENGKTTKISGTIQDITIRKENEKKLKEYSERLEQMVSERTQALEKAQEKLLRKEKLAILGQMAGSIEQELRNPLGVISNSVYHLGRMLPDCEESVRANLAVINQGVQKTSKTISYLMDFSRGQVSEPQTAALSGLVEEVFASQPPPYDIELLINLPQDLPPIFVDIQQIRQVISNLVTNAYDAMPNGGKLSIQALEENGSIKLSIADSGCGISPENLEMIFDPLFTTKDKGIGLGLPISKIFAEANEATIEVESVEGNGSCFTIMFPIMRAGNLSWKM